MSATQQLDQLISDIESELGIGPNEPLGNEPNIKQTKDSKSNNKGGKKKEKPKKAAPVPNDQPDFTKLDIRVGQIVKVWKHETADKLYCEEINVGEDEPRKIASGLVPHYSLEEMKNHRLLVVCNLKARNLVGFKSHGMVLCAANKKEDGSEFVKFVEPPQDAKIGERVFLEGLTGEPITPAQVEKKKIFVKVGEDMKTDSQGVAMWKDHVFMTSTGPCTAQQVPNGTIR